MVSRFFNLLWDFISHEEYKYIIFYRRLGAILKVETIFFKKHPFYYTRPSSAYFSLRIVVCKNIGLEMKTYHISNSWKKINKVKSSGELHLQ